MCAPSRNSLLTSRRPDTLRLYDFYSYWRDFVGNFTTLPQYFKEHGYETRAIGKVFHPGASSNSTDDFPYSWTNVPYHPSTEAFMNEPVCPNRKLGTFETKVICPVELCYQPEGTLPDIQSLAQAETILSATRTRPLFLAVGFHKPHIPFRVPREFYHLHRIDKFRRPDFDHIPYGMPTSAFNPFLDIRERSDAQRQSIPFPFGPVPRRFGERLRQAYYSSVT